MAASTIYGHTPFAPTVGEFIIPTRKEPIKADAMKRIDFKRISKELQEEGITLELLNKVQDSGRFSPAILKPGEEAVVLIKANPVSFWVQLEDGKYLKDQGKLVTIDLKTVIVGRARYWLVFRPENWTNDELQNEAIELEISKEIKQIKASLKHEAQKLVSEFRMIETWRTDTKFSGAWASNPFYFDQKKKEANQFFNKHPNASTLVSCIESCLNEEDYDRLFLTLRSNGLPLLASVEYTDEQGMQMLKDFFSRSQIENTVTKIQSQSHIRNVAMLAVQRRYAI